MIKYKWVVLCLSVFVITGCSAASSDTSIQKLTTQEDAQRLALIAENGLNLEELDYVSTSTLSSIVQPREQNYFPVSSLDLSVVRLPDGSVYNVENGVLVIGGQSYSLDYALGSESDFEAHFVSSDEAQLAAGYSKNVMFQVSDTEALKMFLETKTVSLGSYETQVDGQYWMLRDGQIVVVQTVDMMVLISMSIQGESMGMDVAVKGQMDFIVDGESYVVDFDMASTIDLSSLFSNLEEASVVLFPDQAYIYTQDRSRCIGYFDSEGNVYGYGVDGQPYLVFDVDTDG